MLRIKYILSVLCLFALSACSNSDTGAVVGNVAVLQGGGVVNNGPISGATITINKLDGTMLGSTTTVAYNAARDTTVVGGQRRLNTVGRSVGSFAMLAADFNLVGILPTDILLVRASGGTDIDPNDDGIISPTGEGNLGPFVTGSNYAFVQFSDLQNNNIVINQFTTLAYASINDVISDPVLIRQRLTRFAKFYFKDINGDGFSDYRDSYFYSPAKHTFDVNGNPSRDHDKFLSDPHFLRDLLFLKDPYTNQTFMQALRSNPNTVAEIATFMLTQFGDVDGDALPDIFEDPVTIDTDGDGIPNATDPDDDNDGMNDVAELANGLNPWKNDANADPDGDGVSNINELAAGTNPFTLPLLAVGVPSTNTTTTEAGGRATLTFQLTSAPTANVLVDVYSANITEISITPALLTFTSGNWSTPQTVRLIGVDDTMIDGNQTVNIVGTVQGGSIVDTAFAAVTNLDNEIAGIVVSAASGTTSEAAGTATFNIALQAQPMGNLSVDLYSSNTAEVTVPTTINFTPANWNVAQLVTMTGVDDPYTDGNQVVTITAVSRRAAGYTGQSNTLTVTNNDNEIAGLVLSPVVGNTSEDQYGQLGYSEASFNIALQAQPAVAVNIIFSSANTSEVNTPTAIRFNAMNWNVPQTVVVTGVDDVIVDGNPSVAVYATASGSGYGGLVSSVNITNIDNDVSGLVVNNTLTTDTNEIGSSTSFTVSLLAQPTANVIVDVYSSDTTEVVVNSNTMTFTPMNWNTAQIATVIGVDDPYTDGNKPVILTAQASTTGNFNADTYTLTIQNIDNDIAAVVLSTPTGSTTETQIGNPGFSNANFNVKLSNQPTASVNISFASDKVLEIAAPAPLTFTPANWDIYQNIVVQGLDDTMTDGNQVVTLTATASVSGGFNGETASVQITNIDNEIAGVSATNPVGFTDENAGTTTFSVALNAQPTADVYVTIQSQNTAEVANTGPFTFTTLNWNAAQTVTLTGVADLSLDGNVVVDIYAIATGGGYNGELAAIQVTNNNTDVAGISANVSGPTTENGTPLATLNVRLIAKPNANVVVDIYSTNLNEVAVAPPPQLTFTVANWNVFQNISLAGVNDPYTDGNQIVNVYARVNAPSGGYTNEFSLIPVTNNDNDVASITATAISNNTSESGTTATFSVMLAAQPTANVVLDVYSANVSEVQVDAGYTQLTFSQLNWNMPQTVQVSGVDDPYTDGVQTTDIYVQVNPAAGGYSSESAIIRVSNDDNDIAAMTATAMSNNTNEIGTTATFTVVLTAQPTANILLDVYSANVGEVQVDAGYAQLTFSQANWNMPQTVQVSGVDDPYTDGVQTTDVYVQVKTAAGGYTNESAIISVSNDDNEIAAITATAISNNTNEIGTSATFTVMLAAQPTANVVLDVYSANIGEVQVDAGYTQLTFTQANWNTVQTVQVSGVDDPYTDGVQTTDVYVQVKTASGGYTNQSAIISVSNDDNEIAAITATAISNNTNESGTTATFTVILAAQPTANVLVDVYSANVSEVQVDTGYTQLTFTQANWNMPQTVQVSGVDDPYTDGVQITDVYVQIKTATGGYTNQSAIIGVSNDDNEIAGMTATAISNNTNESGTTATFTVVLAAQPTANVLVDVYSANVNEVQVDVGYTQLTFTQANWNVTQLVQLRGVDDPYIDGVQTTDVYVQVKTAAGGYTNQSAIIGVSNDDNEIAGITTTAISNNTNESGTTATFTVMLNAQPLANVVLDVYSANIGEVQVDAGYTQLTFSSLNWNTAQIVQVSGVDDPYTDGVQTTDVYVQVNAVSGGYSNESAIISVSNDDNEIAAITATAISNNTNESGTTATFTVILAAQPTANVLVDVYSANVSEVQVDTGYTQLTFTQANWNMPQTVQVSGVDDPYTDGVQTTDVYVQVKTAAGGYTNQSAIIGVSNNDNEIAGMTATAISNNTNESGTTATFTVVLAAQPTANVLVDVYSANVSEVQVDTGYTQLTFTQANWNTAQTVQVSGVDDPYTDGVQITDVYVQVKTAAGGYTNQSATISVSNDDNDVAGMTATAISNNTNESGTTATFTVVLAAQPTASVLVDVYSANVSEVQVDTGYTQLTFTQANWNMPQTVQVSGVDDPYTDGVQTTDVYVQVKTAAGGYTNQSAIIGVSNDDNEIAGITTTAISNNTSESGTTATFTVMLAAQPTANVVLDVYSANVSEVQVDAGYTQLTFSQANWNVAQTVQVSGVDDPYTDGVQITDVYVQVNAASGGYTNESATISISNDDNELAGITTSAASNNTSEIGTSATFTIMLAAQPTANVVLDVYSANIGEVQVDVGYTQLTFTQANWNTAQTVQVSGVDDPYTDGVQTTDVYVQVNAASGGYTNESATISVSNDDNEVAAITATAISNNTSESGTTATFTVMLAAQPTTNVVLDVYSANIGEVQVDAGYTQLTFSQANWNTAQIVQVSGVDDPYTDGNQIVNVYARVNTPSGGYTNEFSLILVTNNDNEIAAITASAVSNNTNESGTTATFTLVLDAQPTANTLIDVYSTNIGEVQVDAGYTQLTFTQANWNMPQTVQVSGVNDVIFDGTQAVNVYANVNSASIAAFANTYTIIIVSNDEDDLEGGIGDGMPDDWEVINGLNINIDDSGTTMNRDPYTGAITDAATLFDLDRDGLINIDEFICGSNPNGGFVDTDFDGFSDDFENCPSQTGWTTLGAGVADLRDNDQDLDGIADYDEYIDYHFVNNGGNTPYILQTRKGQAMQAANFAYVPGGWDVNNDGVNEPGFWIAKYEAKDTGVVANTAVAISTLLQGAKVFNPTLGTARFMDRLCDNGNGGTALDTDIIDNAGACRGNKYVATTLTTMAMPVNRVNFVPAGVPLTNESWLEARASVLDSAIVAATTLVGLGGTLTNPDLATTMAIDLPSEVQHMQLIQLVINNAADWYGNVVGVNGVFRGNADGLAATAFAVGTGINTRTHIIANGVTVLDFSGATPTAKLVNDPRIPSQYSTEVYDLAGNVYEWSLGMIAASNNTGAAVGGDRFIDGYSGWVQYDDVLLNGVMPLWWKPVLSDGLTILTSNQSAGRYNDGLVLLGFVGGADTINIGYSPILNTGVSSGFSAIARGGLWNDSTLAGVATSTLIYGPGYQGPEVGFRAAAP